jgi:hypothetical protein
MLGVWDNVNYKVSQFLIRSLFSVAAFKGRAASSVSFLMFDLAGKLFVFLLLLA